MVVTQTDRKEGRRERRKERRRETGSIPYKRGEQFKADILFISREPTNLYTYLKRAAPVLPHLDTVQIAAESICDMHRSAHVPLQPKMHVV